MTTFRNIVVGTDFSAGSQAAVERAVQLALAHGASLRLLHAFDVSAWHSLKGVFDAKRFTTDLTPDVRAQHHLNEQAQALAARTGLDVQARFSVGRADSAINSYVSEHGSALVVIGSRAEPALVGLGSTVAKVLRAPAGPVLVVRWAESRPYQQVLSAVDLGDASLRAVAFAIRLWPGAHHHLLHALDPARARAVWMDAVSKEPIQELHDKMQAQASDELAQLVQALPKEALHPLSTELLDAAPARAIIERAAALPADCVVVGYGGQGTASERLLGNMAQHVLQHTLRDVLVVP